MEVVTSFNLLPKKLMLGRDRRPVRACLSLPSSLAMRAWVQMSIDHIQWPDKAVNCPLYTSYAADE